MNQIIPEEAIAGKILLIRGQKVLLDVHLAQLYGVKTKVLLQSVRRNSDRFPADFMFQLSHKEFEFLRSHFVTSNSTSGGRRYLPYAFTEQGVAMLSSVLRSSRAVHVNIAIMRTFVNLRKMLSDHEHLAKRLFELERQIVKQGGDIQTIFQAIRQLMAPQEKPKRSIGFTVKEPIARYRTKKKS